MKNVSAGKYKFGIYSAAALLIVGSFCFFGQSTSAATDTHGNLKITYNDPLFTVVNAAPGGIYYSDVTIENIGGATKEFQFEVNMAADSDGLAEKLFFKVYFVDKNGVETCEFGCATNRVLSSLDGTEFFVKNIPGNTAKKFRLAIEFDSGADYTFMGKSTGFDMKLGYSDRVVDDGGGGGGANPTLTGGAAPTGFLASFFSPFETTAGAETAGSGGTEEGQGGEVKGEEAQSGIVEGEQIATCRSWPKWAWIVLIVAYFIGFIRRTFGNLERQVVEKKIRWAVQVVLALAAVLLWYFFDGCRNYLWFSISAIVGGAAVYLYYLYLFRKRIHESQGKIKGDADQNSPQNPI